MKQVFKVYIKYGKIHGSFFYNKKFSDNTNKVRELEEEQQRLNESVFSLSTHFAHIQFRIQQINQVPSEKRDVIYFFNIIYGVFLGNA